MSDHVLTDEELFAIPRQIVTDVTIFHVPIHARREFRLPAYSLLVNVSESPPSYEGSSRSHTLYLDREALGELAVQIVKALAENPA